MSIDKLKTFEPRPDYDYLRRSFLLTVWTAVLRALVLAILWPYFLVFHGIRLRGLANVRALRGKGYVAVCNHVHTMDSPLASEAIGLRRTYYVTLTSNLRIPVIHYIVRGLGGVPLGQTPAQLERLARSMEEALRRNKVVMVYPEGELESYCRGLRPFRRGAFRLAAAANSPILPMVVTYRAPAGLWKYLRKKPFLTLNVLPPLQPDETLAPRERSFALMSECRAVMEKCVKEHA
jgi:1-acyl-sn-glycerol-3-phosphate acyltransferase